MNKFTDEELSLLSMTPSLIGSAIAFSASSGVMGMVSEAMTNAKAVLGGVKSYPNNGLIGAVAPNIEDRQQAIESAKKMRSDMTARIKDKGINTKEKLHQQILDDCRQVARILDEKADSDEAAEYKEWTMEIAEKVAMSAKEGGFLGFGGERLSDGEKTAIGDVASALGTKNPLV